MHSSPPPIGLPYAPHPPPFAPQGFWQAGKKHGAGIFRAPHSRPSDNNTAAQPPRAAAAAQAAASELAASLPTSPTAPRAAAVQAAAAAAPAGTPHAPQPGTRPAPEEGDEGGEQAVVMWQGATAPASVPNTLEAGVEAGEQGVVRRQDPSGALVVPVPAAGGALSAASTSLMPGVEGAGGGGRTLVIKVWCGWVAG